MEGAGTGLLFFLPAANELIYYSFFLCAFSLERVGKQSSGYKFVQRPHLGGQANSAEAFSCQPLLSSPASPGSAGPPLLSVAHIAPAFSLWREQTTIPKG